MGWGDRLLGSAMMCVAGLWTYLAFNLPFPAFAKSAKVGPGHFPAGVAILLGILSMILLARTFPRKTKPPAMGESPASSATSGPEETQGQRNLFLGLGMFTAYIVATPLVGFIPASASFVLAMTRIAGKMPWRKCWLVAVLITGILWTLFVLWLQVPLPAGVWGQ